MESEEYSKMLQYYMDSGLFDLMGITNADTMSPDEQVKLLKLLFEGTLDDGESNSGNTETGGASDGSGEKGVGEAEDLTYGSSQAERDWYSKHAPTFSMEEAASGTTNTSISSGAGPVFSFANGVYAEGSGTGEGASIDLSGLFTQSLSSEDFNATLVSALTTALNTAFAAEDLWTGVGETFSGGFATLVDAQAETFKSQGLFIGTSMAAGIQEGIENGTADVCNAIRLVASNAVHEAKKRLDINSPSRVFRQIGLSTGEGFALGIDESLLLAENAAMRMAEGVARAGAGTNAGAGRGAVVNLNVNQPSIRSDDDVRRLSEEFARYTAAMTYGL